MMGNENTDFLNFFSPALSILSFFFPYFLFLPRLPLLVSLLIPSPSILYILVYPTASLPLSLSPSSLPFSYHIMHLVVMTMFYTIPPPPFPLPSLE
jgi:hypothetical protein